MFSWIHPSLVQEELGNFTRLNMLSLHNTPRPIYLSRHGQSKYNVMGKVGGDSDLSKAGEEYATSLAKFVKTDILQAAKRCLLYLVIFFIGQYLN